MPIFITATNLSTCMISGVKLIRPTLTEVFPCYFLSCKANARVKLAKTGHSPHYSQLDVICVLLLLFVFSVLFVSFYVLLCVNTIAVDKYIVSFIIIRETTELTVSTVVKCYTETVMLKLSNFTP